MIRNQILNFLLDRETCGKTDKFFNFKSHVSETDSDNIENLISNMKISDEMVLESPFDLDNEDKNTNVWRNRIATLYLFSEYNQIGPFDIVYFRNTFGHYPTKPEQTSKININKNGDFFNFLEIHCENANINRLQFEYEHPYIEMEPIELPPTNKLKLPNVFIPSPVNGHIHSVLTIFWDKPIENKVQIDFNFGLTKNYGLRTRTIVGPISFNFLNKRYFFEFSDILVPTFQVTDN